MSNYSLAVLLADPRCRAIMAIYKPDSDANASDGDVRGEDGKYTAKRELFKTYDETIAVGDLVVVPSNTRHKVTVVKVVETDVNWDIHYKGEARWIIGRVAMADFTRQKEAEDSAIDAIKEAEKTHERNEMKKKLFAHMDDQQISKLSFAAGQPKAIEGDKPETKR